MRTGATWNKSIVGTGLGVTAFAQDGLPQLQRTLQQAMARMVNEVRGVEEGDAEELAPGRLGGREQGERVLRDPVDDRGDRHAAASLW